MTADRVAACPFLCRRGRLLVLLVTTRRGGRWVLPKGRFEEDLSQRQVAELEAFEEAGVLGRAHGRAGSATVTVGRRTLRLAVYPLEVKRLLRSWPEAGERRRRAVAVDQLESIAIDPGWIRCIRRLAQLRCIDCTQAGLAMCRPAPLRRQVQGSAARRRPTKGLP
ncbi:MAG: NUDIX domain-containing protein [Planctomycetes bacterium]|nr:NUDIX domain-containing protein [Planctomycetota bacterium]